MSEKINYETQRLGTKDGEIKFGHISHDQQIYSCYVNNYWTKDPHYIALVQTGESDWQSSSTLCRSTGQFSVQAGDKAKNGTPSIHLDAKSGDVIIQADSGRIKLIARDLEFIASGGDGTKGSIRMKANEKIHLEAGDEIYLHSKVTCRMVSEKTVEVVGKGVCNLVGNSLDLSSGSDHGAASRGKVRKGGSEVDLRFAGDLLGGIA
tara:strand:+ start:929 stop:1549 length:621 start_codon:yes stop_codon:yes gene_type:complete